MRSIRKSKRRKYRQMRVNFFKELIVTITAFGEELLKELADGGTAPELIDAALNRMIADGRLNVVIQ